MKLQRSVTCSELDDSRLLADIRSMRFALETAGPKPIRKTAKESTSWPEWKRQQRTGLTGA